MYLYNQWLSPLMLWVRIPLLATCTIYFITYPHACTNRNTSGGTSGTETLAIIREFISGFSVEFVLLDLLFYMFCWSLFVPLSFFSVGHSIVYPLISGFSLPLWFLQTFLIVWLYLIYIILFPSCMLYILTIIGVTWITRHVYLWHATNINEARIQVLILMFFH
jgi:hypothetical protein